MTPMENLTLNRMVERNPMLKEMITRLQLDTKTDADILSQKVQNRVEGWYQEFKHVKPMTILHEDTSPRIFWTSEKLAEWIKITNFTL